MENPRRINEKIDEKSMKIRWKIVQNRAWRRVGPSWGLLGCPIGVLERLGSILGASWERLGASWERPGGVTESEEDPTWTPGRDQNRTKIDPKSHWFIDRFLDAILIQKWSQNGFPNLPKAVQIILAKGPTTILYSQGRTNCYAIGFRVLILCFL